jgi:hypothetical protein
VATETATEAQVGYIRNLFQQRELGGLSEEQITWLENVDLRTISKQGASRVITSLKNLPAKPRQLTLDPSGNTLWEGVTAGRYAVQDPYDGVLKFYKVGRPTEGRWAGRVFLDVQASDELYPIKDPTKRNAIMDVIAKDPKEAMLRYGKEIGNCGHCGRTLTNEFSRSIGIGPICRGKMGW